MFAEFVTGMGERISALWLALRGAAEVDDEARELYTRWDRQRLDGMRTGRCTTCSPSTPSVPI